ncbi:MAG: glycosyltransferase family 2 protein [Roseinatronobacter sp.]
MRSARTAIIVIGRNEGARLEACLASLPKDTAGIVYVDSGSTDGSVSAARRAGARVVELDPAIPFTAARARNAGVAALTAEALAPDYLQFIDGDCTLASDWLATACTFLDEAPKAAVVCGRRRERYPEMSVYNRLCDREWNTPVGQARACGGDALMRHSAFVDAGGFRDDLIAGEEPELCVRLRAAGWQVWRIDAEMVLHDAAMTRFGQWWKRARRAGFAAAQGAVLHGRGPDRHGVVQTLRPLFWGIGLPVVTVLGSFVTPWAVALIAAYPAQVIRLALRNGGKRGDWEEAVFLTFGKFPEALGVLDCTLRNIRGTRQAKIIEYK